MLGKLGGAAHLVFRHRLPERNGRSLHRLIAGGAVWRTAARLEALLDPRKIVSLSAADTAGVGGVAVQFDDVIRREARYLMQIVDVLGDDSGNLAGFVKRGERAMTASRLTGDRIATAIGPVALARRAALTAACGLALALAVPAPGAGIVGFALMGAGLAPIVPLVVSAAGAAGHGVETAVSRVFLIAYSGSIAGPAAIGFAAGRVELRAALLIPLVLIVFVAIAAGRIEPAAGGELART